MLSSIIAQIYLIFFTFSCTICLALEKHVLIKTTFLNNNKIRLFILKENYKMEPNQKKANGLALIPFAVFVGVYLTTGITLNAMGVEMAFYQLPTPIASFIGIIVAFAMFKGKFDDKLSVFLHGCGEENIMIMCMVFLFAGAFTSVSSAMGGVDSVVNLGMTFIPPQFIAAGVFVISAFISISTGTSVGTVTAVTPIALGLAQAGGLNQFLVVGATIGGSMFGDNLSMISDTTIAATRTQDVEMKDKFRANFKIALPAALVTFVLLLIFGRPETLPAVQEYSYNIIKVLPYIFVLVASLLGVNVFAVLTGGILFSGAIGLATGSFSALELANNVYNGFSGMFEIFLLSMITGGLAKMVEKEGGLEWLLQKISKVIKNRQTAELGIAVMTIAKDISKEYGVDPKRTASLLDIFACAFQGILPYGAQILFACALMENLNSPFQVITQCWYQFILMAFAILSIFFAKGVDTKKATN